MTTTNTNLLEKLAMVFSLVILIVGAITMVLPFCWMLLTSLKTYQETIAIPITWFPAVPQFSNFVSVWNKLNFAQYYINSITVTICVVTAQITMCSLAAYSFARLKFPGKNIIFFTVLSVLMVPSQMTFISRFSLMNYLGWVNTYKALILPMISSAYGIFFFRQFFLTLPYELEEAAKIDGCSYFRTFWSIIMPLSKNAMVSYGILSMLWSWNELFWPLIITTSSKKYVLSIGLSVMAGGTSGTNYELLMATSVICTFPMFVAFILLQKQFIAGIALSGIKS